MAPAPVVSVVIPTRDRSAQMLAAVASAQAQTLTDIEIIVVNDASTDDTNGVLAQLSATDPRIRWTHNPSPEGAPAARNRGVRESRATLVAFLDDDDEWDSIKLERQVAFLAAHPETVAVGCQFRILRSQGRRPLIHRSPTLLAHDELLWANFLGGTSLLLARKPALADAPFDEDLTNYEDWDLYLRLARAAPIAVVDEVLCRYHDHGGQRLTTTLSKRLGGYSRLVSSHEQEMSPRCLAYHRAKLGLLAATAVPDKAVAASKVLATSTPRVSGRIVADAFMARYGRWRGDPAMGLRRLHRSLTRRSDIAVRQGNTSSGHRLT
jgi:glycosyltransferase involved in cell wall biosynthesis